MERYHAKKIVFQGFIIYNSRQTIGQLLKKIKVLIENGMKHSFIRNEFLRTLFLQMNGILHECEEKKCIDKMI